MNHKPKGQGDETSRKAEAPKALLKEGGLGDSSAQQISRRPADQPTRLSFAQERLLIVDQLVPGSSAYNISRALTIDGPLSVPALEKSLSEIARRHEALRTKFGASGAETVQVISPPRMLPLRTIDLRNQSPGGDHEELLRLVEEEARRPFNLAEGPLFRVALFRAKDERHVLLVVMHHAISDGWSVGILFRELAAHYRAFLAGTSEALPEPPIQYADFAHWQRQHLSGAALDRQMAFWKRQLSGRLPLLELPADRRRPAVPSFRGQRRDIFLPRELADTLKALAGTERASLFMILLAAFNVLLHRYTGQEDILLGTPIANRNRSELEGIIGFFANSLVLRTNLSGDPAFRDLLRRVREVALDAYDHQEMPFEKLVQELNPERDLSRNPIFQCVFTLQNLPAAPPELDGLTVKQMNLRNDTLRFDLEIHLWEQEAGLRGWAIYNTDLFDGSTVERMVAHYQRLLESIGDHPGRSISQLPMLDDAERMKLLVEWNDTRTDYPRERTVHELFEAQAEKSPGAVAVVHLAEQLRYDELNARANRLARHLRELGVGPEVLVGVFMNRSPDMMVALLAILKAGGAYLPLDPDYPTERLNFMLEDAGAPILLTMRECRERLQPGERTVICLDEQREKIARENPANLEKIVSADNLLYVIYTSGSTGTPKGTAVIHRGAVRLVTGVHYVTLGPQETFLQLAPISFDASTLEIWAPLLHGGRCVLFPGQVPDFQELGRIIVEEKVSTLWLTASLFNAIIDEKPEILAPLRQLLTGGEALSVAHVRRALEHLPETQLINGYGPTENTTFTCCYRIPRNLPPDCASIPLGPPISNTEVYVLDRRLNPVPVGVNGELYIGGDGLAREYWRRPELTAERFINHPFRKGAKLYKTGDTVRYRADGTLEFIGRNDDQVKIRGFRVELGEIEAALRGHSEVKDSTVLLREESPGEKQLVAYVVLQPEGGRPADEDLRGFLKKSLPDYMVPGLFLFMEELPLNRNGKVDRKALREMEHDAPRRRKALVGPRTPEEKLLTRLLAELLGVERVGIEDNFFDLGGHSLLATQLVNRLRDKYDADLPLKEVFDASTVEDLARSLASAGGIASPSS